MKIFGMVFTRARNQLFLYVASIFFCDFIASFIGGQAGLVDSRYFAYQ